MNLRRFLYCVILVVCLMGSVAPGASGQDSGQAPLSAQGPHGVGLATFKFKDESRDGRQIFTMVWYPAVADAGSYLSPVSKGEPDTAAAPYPLVIFSPYLGATSSQNFWLGPHLASYGFVVAALTHNDTELAWDSLIDRPYDVLFVLDQLAAVSEGPLVGLIDMERVGVTGYSFGAMTTLQLNGAHWDPAYMLDWCAAHAPEDLAGPPPSRHRPGKGCLNNGSRWDEVAAYRAQYDPPLVEGEPWPALTDPRIKAALAMAPCYIPHWGPAGLAAATVPTLYLMPENDEVCGADDGISMVRQALNAPDRYLLVLLGATHSGSAEDSNIHKVFRHYETAFFGLYLQGQTEYAAYLTPETVAALGNATLEVGAE